MVTPSRLIAAAFLALAGCGEPDNATGPGGVTVGEARALDDAAEMIEGQKLPPELASPGQSATPVKPKSAPPAK